MAFDDIPNKLDAVFVQRDDNNQYYEQINISGSDSIVYLNSDGKIDVDRISVFATKYGLGNSISSSWASSSISSSYSLTASYALNAGGTGGTSLSTGSFYPITTSWADNAATASYLTSDLYVPYINATRNTDLGNFGISGSNIMVVGDVPPPSPLNGKLWYDTSDTSSANNVTSGSSSNSISSSYSITSSYSLNAIDFINIDASEFIPTLTSGCGITTQEVVGTTVPINRDFLVFNATSTTYAGTWFSWPANWTSAMATIHWTATADSGSARMRAGLRCYGLGSSQNEGADLLVQGVNVTYTGSNTYVRSVIEDIIPYGTASAGNRTYLVITRAPTNVADTLTSELLVEGVTLTKWA